MQKLVAGSASRRLVGAFAILTALLATAAIAASGPGLPSFPHTMTYAAVRNAMVRRGFDPAPIAAGRFNSCDEGIMAGGVCDRWPEVEACSVDAFCAFLYRRRSDGRMLVVGTRYGRFTGTAWATRWHLKGVVFAPTLRPPPSRRVQTTRGG